METLTEEATLETIAEREDMAVEKDRPVVGGFVKGKKRTAGMADLGEVERRAARLREATAGDEDAAPVSGAGDDEIDIDDIDGEEEEEEPVPPPSLVAKNVRGVSEKAIPAAVFGGLAAASGDGET